MRLSSRVEKKAIVVTLSGRLDVLSSGELAASLLTLLQEKPILVIDMTQVNYLSSHGMRALIQAIHEAEKKKGRVLFFGLSEMAQELLTHANLLHFFVNFSTLDQALQRV